MQTALQTFAEAPLSRLVGVPSSGVAASFNAPSVVRYCAVAIYVVGKAEPIWLHDGGKIVVFDAKINAQDVLEMLAEGRDSHWAQNGEDCTYMPPLGERGKCNRAIIVTGYDVYNVPAQHAVRSETKGKGWKHHTHWGHWFRGIKGVS
jgi:hypothetical protein